MKIAMYNVTTTTKAGGVETFVWEISKELASRGHEIDIIGGHGNISYKADKNIRIITYPYINRRFIPNLGSRFKKIFERLSFGVFAIWGLLNDKYDAVHIFKPYDFPIIYIFKKIKGVTIFYGSHGTDFFAGDRFFIKWLDIVFACSKFNSMQVYERYKREPIVLYNGFDKEKFKFTPSGHLRNELGIMEDEKVIIAVNRLIKWKGTHNILKAFKYVISDIKAKLIIIGDGDELDNLKRLARELKIEEHVIFKGFVPNDKLPPYFSIADLYVLASLADETFGITICEAMGCGLPVIATSVGGIPEVVQDGISGVLIKPNDIETLKEEIIHLLNDKDLRLRMGKMGREIAVERFTWDKIADRYLSEVEMLWCEKDIEKCGSQTVK